MTSYVSSLKLLIGPPTRPSVVVVTVPPMATARPPMSAPGMQVQVAVDDHDVPRDEARDGGRAPDDEDGRRRGADLQGRGGSIPATGSPRDARATACAATSRRMTADSCCGGATTVMVCAPQQRGQQGESQPRALHARTCCRKFRRSCLPFGVSTDSGWNWTPQTGWST